MSLALDSILLDVDSTLEVAVEIDSAKRSDGTLKTWYFSTFIRETGATETPANETFKPYLSLGGTLGPLSQSLSSDVLFSGLATNSPGTLTLLQKTADSDDLSQMTDYVFAGYPIRIKLGRALDLYASFELYRTVTVSVDPAGPETTPAGLQMVFTLSGLQARLLNESLISKKYVGIPTCAEVITTTALASSSYNAAHDVTSFTIMYRLWISSNPAAARNLISKSLGATNNNFTINYNTTGFIECQASLGGVGTTLHLSGSNLATSSWHTIVWGLLDKTTSYLMIDGTIISTATPSATVNLPATGVRMARFLVGKHLDARIYNRYITPDEARGISAVRSDGLDLGCVACWRFDDGGSATAANDYSSTNADATWTGVLNTDYRWTNTDLGEPELTGRLYPINVGNVLNAPAHLIDSLRERYRGNVDSTGWHTASSNTNLTVKSQGTVLTGGGVDYTAPSNGGDGVFSTTTAEDEPITYDLINNGASEELVYPSSVGFLLMTQRTRLTTSDVSNNNPLTVLAPYPCGYWTDTETTAQNALSDILGESGLCLYEDSFGGLFFDMFLPPTGYGPYGEPCIDLRGRLNGIVEFGNIGSISGSCTIAFWLKVNLADQTAYNFGSTEPNVGTAYCLAKSNLNGNYATFFQSIGSNAGRLGFRIANTTLFAPVGSISAYTWYFVACVFDDTANTMKIYLAPSGSSLVEVATGSNTLSPSPGSTSLVIGGNGYPWISTQHAQIWNVTKNISQLQSLMSTPPVGNESGLVIYIPANEGIGNPVEKVTSTSGAISGSLSTQGLPQWAPKFTVNLNNTPSIKFTDPHYLHPVWNVVVEYNRNRHPMADSDIDSGVSQNDRFELKSPFLTAPFENAVTRSRFKNAKKIVYKSNITDQEAAQKLLRNTVSRFGVDSYFGALSFPPGLNESRLACGLQIGDEIGLQGDIPSKIQAPLSFRVVSVAPNPLQLSTNILVCR